MRELLIDAIMDLSTDEFETVEDVLELAKESEKELIERIISIACYYRDEHNS